MSMLSLCVCHNLYGKNILNFETKNKQFTHRHDVLANHVPRVLLVRHLEQPQLKQFKSQVDQEREATFTNASCQ